MVSRSSEPSSRLPTLIVIAAILLVLAWASASDLGRRPLSWSHWSLPAGYDIVLSPDSQHVIDSSARTDLMQAISQLPLREETRRFDYRREAFGPAWADEDRNGCDTRNDILARDLTNVVTKPGTRGCVVLSGDFVDPYTGRHLSFVRGPKTSEAIQIDHVVALADAWRSGAAEWSDLERRRFANDPLNLLAAEGEANQAKGAASADVWLPPNEGFRCAYVARQVAVKRAWGLSVNEPERLAMAKVAASCPNEKLPSS